ncbi:thiopeptide-type bacteriocin biosynthesis protein [Kibdelosporangium persicum]|uniref:Thiopeptide-type bacteriocin biosynthesis domain-containing protein n=1 Tax=Kibdelosporangium persicum TaxID=2698649 RepID=A0ABX2F6H5_9PSEU|nr:thiopeptide-type bacteriocin biosynthesis protein [Kibdelosporangium persicum]NRN66541.1 Thiopeptide-type bacteriocin biosynthesis domain-containing protein [Kibdelosporangium persicum]
MPDNAWVSGHAFYHGDLDRLLLDVTAPLVAELTGAGLATHHFFLRYWAGGPHLRLRVLPAGESAAEVRRLMLERFEKYFAENPAAERMTADEYSETARWLSAVENAPYPAEMYPNNSLSFFPYEREHAKYGHGGTIEAVERHFAESSRIVLDFLATEPTADHRSTAAAAMMPLAWFAAVDDPALVAEWTRDFPLLTGQPEPAEATEEQRARLVELTKRMYVLAREWRGIDGDGMLLRWARSVGTLSGELENTGVAQSRRVFRVLNSCAHLVCNRLGVSLAEEDVLRRRAAQAVGQLAAGRG